MPNARATGKLRRRTAAALSMGLLACLAACGGSGSSGFDGPASSEADAIALALDQQSCVEFEGMTYCASGATTESGADAAAVDFEGTAEPLACSEIPDSAACVASVGFTPTGFPPDTVYLSVWGETVDGPWVLAATTPPGSTPSGDPEDREAQAMLPEPSDGEPPSPVVFAVLVYLGEVPADLPAVAAEIADFGADFAYLTAELEVSGGSSPPGPVLHVFRSARILLACGSGDRTPDK